MPEEVIITNLSDLADAILSGLNAIAQQLTASLLNAVTLQIGLLIQFVPLMFLSILAFWKPNALLFMLVAGIAMMVGLSWYDVFSTPAGLGISMMLIAYSLVCFGYAIRCLVWRAPQND